MALAALQPTLRMSAVDGALLANGKPFRLKGVTWWGAESAHALPGGLERRSLDELLGMLARYGFNAIKLPFLHQHVLFDEDVPLASFDSHLNPQLLENGRPLKYVAAIRAIARRAASHGLLVFLVAHSLEGLWYSRAISEATVLDSWTALSRQYARAHTRSSYRSFYYSLFSLLLTLSLFSAATGFAPSGTLPASSSKIARGPPRGAAANPSTGTVQPHASARTSAANATAG